MTDITKRIEYISGEVDASNVLTTTFFKSHTNFHSLSHFVESTDCASTEIFVERLECGDLNDFISSTTEFSSWEEMYQAAGNEYLINNLK